MAYLFGDSFDHYATADITTKWTSSATGFPTMTISSSAGRRSGSGFRISVGFGGGWVANLKKTLAPSGAGFVHGMWVKFSAVPGSSGTYIAAIVETGTVHLWLRLNNNYTLSVLRGDGTVLGTSTPSGLADGVGAFIEWKGTIDNSTGSYTVRSNNTQILTGSSADTQNGGTAAWNELWIGNTRTVLNEFSGSMTADFDDLYVLDQSGGADNDFWGDGRFDWHPVTAAGNYAQFTPSAGSNYQNVDDATPDGDTTKNTASAVGQIDSFVLTDLIATGSTIKVVQTVLYAKKSDAGTCTLAPGFRSGGTDNVGTAVGPSTAYAFLLQGYVQDPATSAAWTESNFNAKELLYKQVT